MLRSIILGGHVFIALALIGLVLLQRGKGANAGTGFGAGASGTVFGARGSANFLSRATGLLATLFFATSLTLVYLGTQRTEPESLLERARQEQRAPQPASELPAVESGELPEIEQPPPLPIEPEPDATDE